MSKRTTPVTQPALNPSDIARAMRKRRDEKLSPAQRSELARNAGNARWSKTTQKERRAFGAMLAASRRKKAGKTATGRKGKTNAGTA